MYLWRKFYAAPSIFPIRIPYPCSGWLTSTCVTAPMSFPFCMIGLPLIPCTIPPVAASSSGSVTVSSRFRPFSASGVTRSMRIAYSRTSVPDMTCPTDGIETAGTWHCAQRWTAIRGMIGFRNAVAGTFTATVAKGSAVALYAGATPANWAGTRKYDPSDPAWFTGETPHKGDDTAAKSADSAASAKSGDAKSGKATSDAIRRAATLAAILLPVIVGVTFMAIARRNGKAQSDNSGPNND